jgi:hypothetical protein
MALVDPFDAPAADAPKKAAPPKSQFKLVDPFDDPVPVTRVDEVLASPGVSGSPEMGFFESVGELATGKKRTQYPNAPEFLDMRQPTQSASAKAFPGTVPDTRPGIVSAAYAASATPEGVADIVEKNLPGAKRSKDANGNLMINFEGKSYYVNKPGASKADLFKLVSDAAAFFPAAKLSSLATSLGVRIPAMFATTAATSVGQDVAAQFLGSEQPVDLERAAITGAGGAAFEALTPAVAAIWQKIVQNGRYFQGGRLTAEGVDAARQAGVDPNTLTPDLAAAFANTAARARSNMKGVDPGEVAATDVLGNEFNIPYTQGQRTGDLSRLRKEEATRNEVYSAGGARRMQDFDDRQQQSMVSAVEGIKEEVGKGVSTENMRSGGASLKQSVDDAASASAKRVDDAYNRVREVSASFTGESLSGLFKSVKARVRDPEMGGIDIIDRDLTPQTVAALQDLGKWSRRFQRYTGESKLKMGDIKSFEAQRRKLNQRIESAQGSDRRGLIAIKNGLDDWLDDAFDNSLFAGDGQALALLKDARNARREFSTLFAKRNKNDEAGRLLEKIREEGRTAEEVTNLIFGSSNLFKFSTPKVVGRLKDIFGEDSAQWNTLRQMAFERVAGIALKNDNRSRGTQIFSPTKFASNLDKAIKEHGTVMETLFSRDEINKMLRFAAAAGKTLTPREAMNPSRSGWVVLQAAREMMDNLITAAAFAKAGPLGAGAARIGTTAGRDAMGRMGASGATKPLKLPANAPLFVSAGAAGAAQYSPNQ